ncbi:hypothetical protein AB0I72_26845 [Nocardiopsis sp. NPDC049922]|uniref:hypothetical protein n=1 Tax=Nocardiopsis sp. NPDC049922 TaxID=3155157 RepID=UPI0033C9C48D
MLEHHLVRAVAPQTPAPAHLSPTTGGVYELCRDTTLTSRPVTVMEIAHRRQLPRGVAKLAVTELREENLVVVEEDRTSEGRTATHVKVVVASPGVPQGEELVDAFSDIEPVRVVETMLVERDTEPGSEQVEVAVVYGRCTPPGVGMDLHLITLPTHGGQLLRRDVTRGAAGAIVCVGPDRVDEAADIVAWLDTQQVPLLVTVHATPEHDAPLTLMRQRLGLDPTTPMVPCKATDDPSMLTLLQHLLAAFTRKRH